MDHPSEEILKRFAEATASSEESRHVVAHLLKGCAPCAKTLRELMKPDSVPPVSYEAALDRFDQGMIENLESSISPLQTLRTVLKGVFPRPPEGEKPPKKQ